MCWFSETRGGLKLDIQDLCVLRGLKHLRKYLVVSSLLLLASCGLKDPVTETGPPEIEYKVVRPTIAFEILHDAPSRLIIDLREPEEFNGPMGHLANSHNIPLAQLEKSLPDLEEYKESTFIVLCHQEGDCSCRGMELLTSLGFRYAILMEDGIDGWLKAGYGTVGAPEE